MLHNTPASICKTYSLHAIDNGLNYICKGITESTLIVESEILTVLYPVMAGAGKLRYRKVDIFSFDKYCTLCAVGAWDDGSEMYVACGKMEYSFVYNNKGETLTSFAIPPGADLKDLSCHDGEAHILDTFEDKIRIFDIRNGWLSTIYEVVEDLQAITVSSASKIYGQ